MVKTGWHNWPADAPKPAIAPFDATLANKHQEEWAAYLKVPVEYTNSIGMKFMLIPPGEFTMGSTPEEIRGGGWLGPASSSRSSHRFAYAPAGRLELIGFRVTLVAVGLRVRR